MISDPCTGKLIHTSQHDLLHSDSHDPFNRDMKLCRPDSQKADSRRKGITFSSQELSQTPRKLQAMKSHPLIRDNITINCCSELSPSVMTRKHFFFGLLSLFLVLSFGLPRRNQLPDTLPKKRGLHIWRKKKYFFPNSETTRCIKKELVLRNDEYSFFLLFFVFILFLAHMCK